MVMVLKRVAGQTAPEQEGLQPAPLRTPAACLALRQAAKGPTCGHLQQGEGIVTLHHLLLQMILVP